jgi:hypothetical protein
MWQGKTSWQGNDMNVMNADTAQIFIPGTSADVKKKDYIYRGKAEAITDELIQESRVIKSVSVKDYGPSFMRHIEVIV